MTAEPIALAVTRYQCPFCRRSRTNRRAALDHMARCWYNPAARGCKTCVHFEPASGGGPDHGIYEWEPYEPESCAVDLSGGDGVKAGPIVHCGQWAAQPSTRTA